MRKITEFELVDIGIEHAQYFQGFGASFTNFDYSAVGTGSNAREAIDNALEDCAQQGFDAEQLERAICESEGWENLDSAPTTPNVESYLMDSNPADWTDADGEFDGEDCEHYYYVGIRWNSVESPNLDAMALEELDAFNSDESQPEALREYAAIKARAMRDRAAGLIQRALLWERAADGLYKLLPTELRW
jgi:hypothetical protein